MADRKETSGNPMGCSPVPQLLLSLAVPAVIANVVNALYNIVDQIFIGQGGRVSGKCGYEYRVSDHDDLSGDRAYDRAWRRGGV